MLFRSALQPLNRRREAPSSSFCHLHLSPSALPIFTRARTLATTSGDQGLAAPPPMASLENVTAAAAQPSTEENLAVAPTTANTADMAPTAETTIATAMAAVAGAAAPANTAEASSSRAATDPAEGFPLPSMAAAENTTGTATVTNSGAASAIIPLTEEEENMAERSRYWLPSGVTEEHLTELAESGFLPPKAECTWRAPGEEAEPTPQGDERVILISHLLRGMTLPPLRLLFQRSRILWPSAT